MNIFQLDISEEDYGTDCLWIWAPTLETAEKLLTNNLIVFTDSNAFEGSFVRGSFNENWKPKKLMEAGIDAKADQSGGKLWGALPTKISDKEKRLSELLNNLREDFTLLQDGSWEPDDDSTQCSIDAVEEVMKLLNIKVKE